MSLIIIILNRNYVQWPPEGRLAIPTQDIPSIISIFCTKYQGVSETANCVWWHLKMMVKNLHKYLILVQYLSTQSAAANNNNESQDDFLLQTSKENPKAVLKDVREHLIDMVLKTLAKAMAKHTQKKKIIIIIIKRYRRKVRPTNNQQQQTKRKLCSFFFVCFYDYLRLEMDIRCDHRHVHWLKVYTIFSERWIWSCYQQQTVEFWCWLLLPAWGILWPSSSTWFGTWRTFSQCHWFSLSLNCPIPIVQFF